jgi:hypothetical protein
MLDTLELRPDDRLLLLWIPSPVEVERLAARLPKGLLVAIGSDEEVRAGRRAAAHLDNVMFTVGDANEIPWRDGMFTVAVGVGRKASELVRVVEPGGAIRLREDF